MPNITTTTIMIIIINEIMGRSPMLDHLAGQRGLPLGVTPADVRLVSYNHPAKGIQD